jgi:hypothetical protein
MHDPMICKGIQKTPETPVSGVFNLYGTYCSGFIGRYDVFPNPHQRLDSSRALNAAGSRNMENVNAFRRRRGLHRVCSC